MTAGVARMRASGVAGRTVSREPSGPTTRTNSKGAAGGGWKKGSPPLAKGNSAVSIQAFIVQPVYDSPARSASEGSDVHPSLALRAGSRCYFIRPKTPSTETEPWPAGIGGGGAGMVQVGGSAGELTVARPAGMLFSLLIGSGGGGGRVPGANAP